MKKYLIDANLPRKISVWQTGEYEFVTELNPAWTDSEIWGYARANDLIVVSKDADFSHRIMLSGPPPKIVHLKIGSMKLKEFELFVVKVWDAVEKLLPHNKLINVFLDRIEVVS